MVSLVLLLLLPAPALAQEGEIAGTVRHAADGGVLPGVTVEVTSPALIEGVRSAVTDANGQYRFRALPVGMYMIRFSQPGFSPHLRERIVVSAETAASVNVELLRVGEPVQTFVITEGPPLVDVTSAQQITGLGGEDIRPLPLSRNLSGLMVLVPSLRYSNSAVGREPGGICVGGAGTWCTPGVGGFNTRSGHDPADLAQGQVRLDAMLLNSGSATALGILNGYVADVAHAQAVTFNLAGALGESETGGASIDIVPRTGGNAYRGTYHTTYTTRSWFARNSGVTNRIRYDYDVAGSFGGPILRNRLWFHSLLRSQGKEQQPGGPAFYPNRNAGIWAAPYQPDRARGPVTYANVWRSANLRLNVQATTRNRFALFWDEQESCLDPCRGAVSSTWSPEANWSVRTYPNRLWQLSWASPRTNRVLLEGGVHVLAQHLDFSRHQYERNYPDIPTISEAPTSGCCVGRDEVAPQVHAGIGAGHPTTFGSGGCFWSGTLCSGALGQSTLERIGHARPRLSVSYVTGSHVLKIGWEAQAFWQTQQIEVNAPQLLYNMTSPAEGCYNAVTPAASTCGTPHPMFAASDPFNSERRPRPVSVVMNAGTRRFDDRLMTQAVYVQDRWTIRPVTISGALRYDHARSLYLPTCLGPNVFVSEARAWCTERSDGVRFHDISPRVGVAWDVFNDGLTAVRGHIGRYLQAARFTGIYEGANPARNAATSIVRSWTDVDGNRLVDCDLLNPLAQVPATPGAGDVCGAVNAGDMARFGSRPTLASGRTVFCGQHTPGVADEPALARAVEYCHRADRDVYQGWGVRRHEWQLLLGIERYLRPGAAAAGVAYHHRWFRNLRIDDTLDVGCDLYTGVTAQCQADLFRFVAPIDPVQGMQQYSFYRVQAPVDPRLPDGGAYWIEGLNTRGTFSPLPSAPAVATRHTYSAGWNGIDTHVVLRARGGFRLNGGTSTGAPFSNTCTVMLDAPGGATQRIEGRRPQCALGTPWQTHIRGAVSYTVPRVDVLASAVFQSLPGPPLEAHMTYRIMPTAPGDQPLIAWEEGHEWRATNTVTCPQTTGNPAGTGCFMGSSDTTVTVNLLEPSAMYGARYSLVDLKLAKNIRLGRRSLSIGADVYNLFNSDAITQYNPHYHPQTWHDEDGTVHTDNPWRSPAQVIRPRFGRVVLQIDL